MRANGVRTFSSESLPVVALAAAMVALLLLAALPMDSAAQLLVAAFFLMLMWYLRSLDGAEQSGRWPRLMIIILGLFLTARYLVWRALYTLGQDDWVGTAAACLLFAAEIYSVTLELLGVFLNTTLLTRRPLKVADLPADATIPSVDVVIPSYNEEAELLEVTLRAATIMRYPAGRLHVHLLDDGGTDQKLADPDPDKAAAALRRRQEMQALCARLGVRYHTRPKNEHAKAGNINHALGEMDGDLIAVFDADHIPTMDFLDRTVPWMVLDPMVFLVQTPHFIISPDPIDRNLLSSFRRMPAENDMFYHTEQLGLDFWNAAYFCGSAAVLNRRHLDEVGGIAGETITEDCETTLALHEKGYRSVYVAQPMVAGLAPETFADFMVQRMRWAQGMTQILVLKRPFSAPGLSWHQRLSYMAVMWFWLFPFARLIFIASPLAYLLFGLAVYNATLVQIFAFAAPHLIGAYMISDVLYGRTRWPLVSEIYETVQCVFLLEAVVKVFLNPRKPSFVVTPKGSMLDHEFISPLARIFYIACFILFLGFLGGLYRLEISPGTRGLTLIVMGWNFFNFLIVFGSLGALVEHRQTRAAPRMTAYQEGWVTTPAGEPVGRCAIDDLSAGGAELAFEDPARAPRPGERIVLTAYCPPLGRDVRLPCEVRATHPAGAKTKLGASFILADEQTARDAVALVFGDSDRWAYFLHRRLRPMPFGTAFTIVLHLLWRPTLHHLALLGRMAHIRLDPFHRHPEVSSP
jgi:cellulose synthase (UDP-forming)